MVATDPVDARLLSVVAEMGKAAVHEVAARLGMDPREAASRLISLSAAGVPLLVGVECDPQGVWNALARSGAGPHGTPSGSYQVHGTPSGGYPPPAAPPGPPSGPFPAYGPPQPGPYSGGPGGPPSGPQQPPFAGPPGPPPPGRTGPPSGPFPAPHSGPPSGPFPAQGPGSGPVPPPPASEAPISTWGPPQSASWARGDQPPQDRTQPTVRHERPVSVDGRTGKVGATLQTEGLEGERLSIHLIEVVDPADYLFTAAGYRLQEGERSIVVHTELTNRGTVTFQTLPDLYLVLVTPDGKTISKAPVSLSSRPPHRIGVAPGETAGGHTVYVVGENVEITSVRWSPRPDDEAHTVTWTIGDD